jgi:excisionase family DNA binding protein
MARSNENGERTYLTPPEVARVLRVSPHKVLGWIRRGHLRAVNVGNGSRPRYRISRDSLDAFVLARQVVPPQPRAQRRRRPVRGRLDHVVKFY